MAMQAGIGVSRILVIFGAGYTSTILLKHGKLSDLFGEIQDLVKRWETKADSASDPVAAEMSRLEELLRIMKNGQQPVVINAGSGETGLSGLIIPAGVLGALGYGYMWWKGISFTDLMWVSKTSMGNAVKNLTKHLESVSEALAKTKRHLTQRIEKLDGKVDDAREMTKLIKDDVSNARGDLSRIGDELFDLKNIVCFLDGRIGSLEDKQNLTLAGVDYLCQIVDGKRGPQYQQFLQDQCRDSSKSRGQLTSGGTLFPQGLKGIADIFAITDGNVRDSVSATTNQHQNIPRLPSIKTTG